MIHFSLHRTPRSLPFDSIFGNASLEKDFSALIVPVDDESLMNKPLSELEGPKLREAMSAGKAAGSTSQPPGEGLRLHAQIC
jgi:hypothetical protein